MGSDATPMPEPTADERRAARAFCAALERRDVVAARRVLNESEFVRRYVNAPVFEFGQRPAHTVATSVAMLDLLIEFGADVNLRSEWPNGPFTVLDNASDESARFLLSKGATLTAHAAARLGWLAELRQLVDADPSVVHERGGDGKLPLHDAANVAIADYLLDKGSGIDVRCLDHKSTPAQYAVAQRPDVCRRLLERGAAPDIFMAARLGDVPLSSRVLGETPDAVGARIGEPGYDPVPPQHIYCWTLGVQLTPHAVAYQQGHHDVYELLLRHSPPKVRLLDAATRGDADAARAVLASAPGLVSGFTTEHGLLAHAIFHGRFEAAGLMLSLGFDPAAAGVDGGSALHAAAWMGHAPLVERILATGKIPIDARDPKHGSPPLGWAVFGSVHRRAQQGDYVAVVDRLIAAGADVHAPANSDAETYVGMAEGNDRVQAALRKHGAA